MLSRSCPSVKLMSRENAHHFSREEYFQIWIKDYEGKLFFFCGLTCMDELFTTEIAKWANKINIVNFDFTLTLTLFYLNLTGQDT